MAGQAPQIELTRDNVLRIHHPRLLTPQTYLTADVSATGTSLTVSDNEGFSDRDIVLFSGFNQPIAEIKRVNGAPSAGTTLTVIAVTFGHAKDTPLYKLPFNQIEISGTNTSGGSKTVITTVDLNVTDLWTEYDIAGGTAYSYYYVRYYNSYASSPYYGDYSDEIASTGFGPKTIGFIRRTAFSNLGVDFGGIFTSDWVYDQMYLCELDILKYKQNWGELVVLDYDNGSVTTGDARIALPTNIDLKKTNKGVLSVYIGVEDALEYVDWKEFQSLMRGVAQTTLASTAPIGATTLVLTDSDDFDDDGTVEIDETEYDYTANNRSTNTLSGLTALTAEITSGKNVWQNAESDLPDYYSINDGYIYWNCPVSSDYTGRSVFVDYFKTVTTLNSDGDEVSFSDPQLYIWWLEVAIKKRKNNGVIEPTDISLLKYEAGKRQLAERDKNPFKSKMMPMVPC
jgi:hypothetical protein